VPTDPLGRSGWRVEEMAWSCSGYFYVSKIHLLRLQSQVQKYNIGERFWRKRQEEFADSKSRAIA